jgi:gamma-glutamylcyclotransferase (GGCT)/AIG2-like uncharacterized protein YtfP
MAMSDFNSWWQEESPQFLAEALPHINSSRTREEPIGRCDDLCKALNNTWNAYFRHRKRSGQLNATEAETPGGSDEQGLRELLVSGLTDEQASSLCQSESVRRFSELTPHIMNHDTLRCKGYDPLNITGSVRKKASEKHHELFNAFSRYRAEPDDATLRKPLLKKIASLLYIVRSNIAHSEKTPKGPDLAKTERDRLVCQTTSPVIEELFDILFQHPSQRLAVYGTLAPGEPNASQLAGLDGEWSEGVVEGDIEKRNGLPQFQWRLGGAQNVIRVFCSAQLGDQFARLDRFEGTAYQRILVPVVVDGRTVVTNIYEAKMTEGD